METWQQELDNLFEWYDAEVEKRIAERYEHETQVNQFMAQVVNNALEKFCEHLNTHNRHGTIDVGLTEGSELVQVSITVTQQDSMEFRATIQMSGNDVVVVRPDSPTHRILTTGNRLGPMSEVTQDKVLQFLNMQYRSALQDRFKDDD